MGKLLFRLPRGDGTEPGGCSSEVGGVQVLWEEPTVSVDRVRVLWEEPIVSVDTVLQERHVHRGLMIRSGWKRAQ